MSNYDPWEIDLKSINSSTPLKKRVELLCRFAILSPSVHNTQPWKFKFQKDRSRLIIIFDESKRLPVGDATGREAWISVGCCLGTITWVTNALGLSIIEKSFDGDKLALKFKQKVSNIDQTKLHTVLNRFTDRSNFEKQSIKNLDEITKVESPLLSTKVLTDTESIEYIANKSAHGITLAMTQPEFREELSHLLIPNSSDSTVGMPGFMLGLNSFQARFEASRMKQFAKPLSEGKREYERIVNCGAVVLIFGKGDVIKYWLAAGSTYQHIALQAAENNVHHSVAAAAVEAPDLHKKIAKHMNTRDRLLCVLRLGYSNQTIQHTPRESFEDLVAVT